MADFKDEISAALARRLAEELHSAWSEFPEGRFLDGIDTALEPLALMARVDVLADRLVATLPPDFDAAAQVLWQALESPGFTGWMTLPCGHFVARAGIDQPAIALPLLAGLTPRWSMEFAIRPFIERHPDTTFEHLRRWTRDPDEHVRRLISEGTRPRLPWAAQLRALRADPSPSIGLLDMLVDDPSEYVRRSVGNHLNDIAKDHPETAIELARRWQSRGAEARWTTRHGLRTMVKRGDPAALELLGVAAAADIRLTGLSIDCDEVRVGEAVTFTLTLELFGADAGDAIIDYRVHYVGANGTRRPKVFKLTRRRLEPGQPVTISRRHVFKHVSIRQIRPGRHVIDVQVNGNVLGAVEVDVAMPTTIGA